MAEEFLEGLPSSVRESLEVQNSTEQEEALEKLFNSETSIEKNKVILAKLREQLKALEKSMVASEGSSANSDGLERFGDAFFRTLQSSFMPVNAPNLGGDYIIDVGDSFDLMLTGKVSKQESMVVQRDGSISIPTMGKVFVAGKSLSEVDSLVTSFVTTTSFGTNSFLTLSKIRDVQILILGGVERPGIYTLSGGASVLGAVNVAGGISERGSYRMIELRRGGETIEVIDLYNIFVFGNYEFKNTLRSGDTIFINPLTFQVPVSGGVNIPAIYEAIKGETISDMISFAGGFSSSFEGYNDIYLSRVSTQTQILQTVGKNQLSSVLVAPRDSIKVPSYMNAIEPIKQVVLEGMVQRPGTYFISDGEKLSDVVKRAGGYKSDAYVYGAALFREEALDKEELYAQLNYSDTVNYIVSNIGKSGGSIGAGALNLLVEELRSRNLTGRVIADFNIKNLKDNPGIDITLEHNDRLVIPSMQKVVYMFGDFKNPSNFTYDPNLDIGEYIQLAGGLKDSAYSEVIIIDPDGRTQTFEKRFFVKAFASRSVSIYPGSIIYAPRDIGKLSGLTYAATISPVLSSLALTLASFNSITD
jgi:protein involved in polysaccharide export with SLBB domain